MENPADGNEARAFQKTACILCSINCGIEVLVEGRHIARVRGDRKHPASQGYLCEKAQRLDHYQNGRDRISTPLRRRPDGTFEPIDWDTAITEIAGRLRGIRDRFGGASIFYYGGGGQGNHLCGAYASATLAALGSVYRSNALAQEKTGEFWVDGQLFGRPRCHTAPDFEHAEVAVFVGKNPWHSHGFPQARHVLKEIAADPSRALVVIDPRKSETARLARYHLQVRPGTDAFCLAALLGTLVQEDLVDHGFLEERTTDKEPVLDVLRRVPIGEFARRAGVEESLVREVARRLARAKSVSILEDLGVQQAPHSTLDSWLEKLVYILLGSFGKPGGMNIHSRMMSLGGGKNDKRANRTPVTGARIITGLVPCNVIPDEILGDHPDRFRAMIVESANPAHSLADSRRFREAFAALDLLVVIDVALTETARQAHYVLPTASQFEKWEATFFTLEFPRNTFQLRAPVLEPLAGTLPEAEIHRRLVRALGALDGVDLGPLAEAARAGRAEYAMAFMTQVGMRPQLMPLAPVILYETLGPTLPAGAEAAAVLWGIAQTCVMSFPDSTRRAGFEDGDALFDAILRERSGVTFTVDPYEKTWERLDTPDKRIRLTIPELLPELEGLLSEREAAPDERYPFILSAGERRSSTANTIYRDPSWRKVDPAAALRMSPADAERLGVLSGARVLVTTEAGSATATVEVSDSMAPGHASLPNGGGLVYPDGEGANRLHGTAPNELTHHRARDWLAGTPWHKHVPARIEPIVE
ncbi:molybdopterin-dependent oxidoreductase [Polyangium aurulentum]|uniref:molybdopterin-dependent oxidoreductase n=1 Tax=Polyangium aurulentum TaxID=2567896 RepID=UPI0010ADF9FB|nr:molybdopterin-dependent oxidoreductase [Polyangium aurulentum]UQA54725.1 molybdopterin-dependent oxidoreductase [Polyangium aurulentum]